MRKRCRFLLLKMFEPPGFVHRATDLHRKKIPEMETNLSIFLPLFYIAKLLGWPSPSNQNLRRTDTAKLDPAVFLTLLTQ